VPVLFAAIGLFLARHEDRLFSLARYLRPRGLLSFGR
jgi:hypothetical protein